MPLVLGLDHVQLAMPVGGEEVARAFYGGFLGLLELPKPEPLRSRGGLWFQCGSLQLHLGVDPGFRAAVKAHPAFRVLDLESLERRLRAGGYPVDPDGGVPGIERSFTKDPFGNRIELIQAPDAT